MPLPGLHPSSRSPSLESAEQLRELGEIAAARNDAYIGFEIEDEKCAPGSPSRRSSEMELNEVLNLNASIYDLTVQYSCLACHKCGGSVGFPGLITVLILEALNVYVQMSILLEVNELIATPAKAHVADLYKQFTYHCYNIDSDDDTANLVYSQDVFDSFHAWDEPAVKIQLCKYPLTAPAFFLLILLIWTFYLMHELKQTLYVWWHTLQLDLPVDGGKVTFLGLGDNFVITHMSRGLKLWISSTVFMPKLCIAVVLWYIGAGWLTATAGIDNLVLNSLALTFICEVDELIFRTCISEVAKSCLDKTKLPLPSFKYTPNIWVPTETLSTCMACIALSYVYLYHMQDAIPDFRWDLTSVCKSHQKESLHGSYQMGMSQYR
jgi:hypothetical protein